MQMLMQKAAKEGDLPEVLRLFEMAPVTVYLDSNQGCFPPLGIEDVGGLGT